MSSIPGMSRSTQKNFQPLRHQGRLGHVQLSGDRAPADIAGMNMPESNYKSVGEFHNQNMAQGGLFKSRSQAKQLQPVRSREGKRTNYLNPLSNHQKNSKTMNYGAVAKTGESSQVKIQDDNTSQQITGGVADVRAALALDLQ